MVTAFSQQLAFPQLVAVSLTHSFPSHTILSAAFFCIPKEIKYLPETNKVSEKMPLKVRCFLLQLEKAHTFPPWTSLTHRCGFKNLRIKNFKLCLFLLIISKLNILLH